MPMYIIVNTTRLDKLAEITEMYLFKIVEAQFRTPTSVSISIFEILSPLVVYYHLALDVVSHISDV